MSNRFVQLVMWLVASFGLSAQTHQFKLVETEKNLIENTANVLFEDREGFIWIGTQAGVVRYSGSEFTTFDNLDDNGLSNNMVEAIHQDQQGNMWIGTRKGLNKIDKFTGEITPILPKMKDGKLDAFIRYGMGDDDRFLYFLTKHHLYRLNKNTLEYSSIQNFGERGSGCLLYRNEVIYYSIENEVFTYCEGQTQRVTTLPHAVTRLSLIEDQIVACTRKGIFTLDGAPFPKSNPLSDVLVLHAVKDDHGTLWVGSTDGIYAIEEDRIHHYPAKSMDASFGDLQLDALIDRSGNVWFGSSNGVVLFNQRSRKIQRVNEPKGEFALPGINIKTSSYDRDEHRIAIGTTNGLLIGEVVCGKNFQLKDQQVFLEGKKINYVKSTEKGVFWIGTAEGEIFKYRNRTLRKVKNPRVKMLGIRGIIQHMDKTWVAYHDGLALINENLEIEKPEWLNRIDYTIGLFKVNDTLLVSHSELVYHLDVKHEEVKPLNKSYSSPMFSHVSGTDEGYWVSTISGGSFRIDNHGQASDTVLKGRNIWLTIEDSTQRIWCATDNGIVFFDEGEARTIGTDDGLLESDLNMTACVMTENGWLVVGGSKGLSILNVYDVHSAIQPSQIHVLGLEVGYQNTSLEYIHHKKLEIGPFNKSLTFTLAIPNYNNGEDGTYTYRIPGVQDQWSPERRINEKLHFTSLPSGNHVLQIRGLDGLGTKTDILRIPIYIIPPFYETWWFQISVFSVIGLLIFWYATLKEKQKRKLIEHELATQRVVVKERERIARDLHDSLGAGLSKIAMDLDILELKSSQAEGDFHSTIEGARSSTDAALLALRESIWTMDASSLSVSDLQHRIGQFMDRVVPNDIKHEVAILGPVDKMELSPEAAVNALRIVQEITQNMVKHSKATHFRVELGCSDQKLQVNTVDNGVGFEPKTTPKGNGLNNIQKRCQEIGANLQMDSRKGNGTEYRITITGGVI